MLHILLNILKKFEVLLLSLLLLGMILLACIQIWLRLFYDSGLNWIDPLLRHLVVWSGFLGAMLAVSRGKHISLDISGFLLPPKIVRILQIIGELTGSIVCGLLSYASVLFIESEMEFGSTTLLAIPSWVWNLIFPIAFTIMTVRFFLAAISRIAAPVSSSAAKGDRGR